MPTSYIDNSPEMCAKAARDGFTVIKAGPKELLLDLDTDASWKALDLRLQELKAVMPELKPLMVEEWLSKSGVGHHVRISVALLLTRPERIALEALLGSDPKRAMYGFAKHWRRDDENVSILFRPPGATGGLLTDDDVPF